MKDTLVKAIAGDFRIYAARTTTLVGEAVRRHDCHPVAAAALGRTMTGALLLAANLKNEEALTVKFAGDGPLGTVVADAVPEGFVRGCVDHPQVDLPLNAAGKLDVGAGVGAGLVSVTRFTGLKEPVVGSCEILTGEIAEDLTKYLYDSEQTPSSVALGVLVAPDFTILAAGGFFVQPLPGASEEGLTRLEENLASLPAVSDMVHGGMTAREMAERVLAGCGAVEIIAETDLAFRCPCSKERVERVLLGLGRDDLASLVDDGKAEVCCHFCGEKYLFTGEELERLLREKSGEGSNAHGA
ncbi:Hsp33 family molecular chaperone HslO [uncultured Selenomonas sp.]|uniref:Hsp33 family molecular chaperone HslO n=1 Tax=uncultured Selenomonas sp. TaxID=159275 RepID=UPI0028DBB0FD|nr:Hsp33 family molecular chaperone HslO [uncultured Selenomonas sp.]